MFYGRGQERKKGEECQLPVVNNRRGGCKRENLTDCQYIGGSSRRENGLKSKEGMGA